MTNPFASMEVSSGGGKDNYINLKSPGEYKVRILSEPIQGYLGWTIDNKPKRMKFDEPYDISIFKDRKVSKFMAVVVWDYQAEKLKIFETDKATILKPLIDYAKDEDFGDLRGFDIKIKRKGTTKDNTEYSVKALQKSPVDKKIAKLYKESNTQLSKLFTGEDPFASSAIKDEDDEESFV